MTKHKRSVWVVPVLVGGAALILGAGCKQPAGPSAPQKIVENVTVTAPAAEVTAGNTLIFTAEVSVSGGASDTVTWSVAGKNEGGGTVVLKSGTTIPRNGNEGNNKQATLRAAADETAASLIVTAVSTEDPNRSGTATVTVVHPAAQPLPPPQNVTLSDQGGATWTASSPETNVVRYSVQLYKGGDPVGSAQTVTKGATYSVNFLSAMLGGGVGSYTVKVKAAGDGQNYTDSSDVESAAQSVSQKAAVAYIWWFETTKARWVNVDGDSNYAVQLYKGGDPLGGPVQVTRSPETNPGNPAETVTTYDFTSAITGGSPGSYTFGVVTKGNGYLILDAVEKVSGAYVNKDLPAPTGLIWDGTTAKWNTVTGAEEYSVQLYKNGSPVGTAVSVTTGTSYTGFNVSAPGVYTFTVVARGNGGTTLDSPPANSADTAGDAGKLSAGATASITLTAANESGKLTVTVPEALSISKGGQTNSLSLTVSGDSFTAFTWVVDGIKVTASGNGLGLSGDSKTLTINAAHSAIKLGGHSVTVYATKGGVPWSPESAVKFTVTK
jgi:hypothetical protein